MDQLESSTGMVGFSVGLIVVLIAGLAFFVIVLTIQLTKIAEKLEGALQLVDLINDDATVIVPGLEHINRTGGVVAGALPLLYGFAERVIKGVSPTPAREHIIKPPNPTGVRRSRLLETVGYTPDGPSTNGHGH
jgi:hypothetical protein